MFCKVQTTEQIICVSKLAKRIWKEHFTSLIGSEQVAYMLSLFLSEEAIEKAIHQEHYEFYMIVETEPIGFISIKAEDDSLFLSKLYVEKAKRGQGYARKAMNFIEQIAKEKQMKSVWLTCNKYNETSLAIYNKMGFTIFDSVVNDIGNGYVMDDFYLKKLL